MVLGVLLQGPLTSRGPKENLRWTDQETTCSFRNHSGWAGASISHVFQEGSREWENSEGTRARRPGKMPRCDSQQHLLTGHHSPTLHVLDFSKSLSGDLFSVAWKLYIYFFLFFFKPEGRASVNSGKAMIFHWS